eukprot:278887-Chlamydomonas_euryale.AAC.2
MQAVWAVSRFPDQRFSRGLMQAVWAVSRFPDQRCCAPGMAHRGRDGEEVAQPMHNAHLRACLRGCVGVLRGKRSSKRALTPHRAQLHHPSQSPSQRSTARVEAAAMFLS